ncbi:protein phosphatase 2C [Acrasis kona]|uniref:protein-serine/threonine phosphatase n=1 Tax=Acrasis kona TaxID=1008807 RepID=A0AAW2ZHZ9_9EUKA
MITTWASKIRLPLLTACRVQGRNFFRGPTDKDVYTGHNKLLNFGCVSMAGYREELQDRHVLKLNALEDVDNYEYEKFAINTMSDEFVACFAVFDGHGGSVCSTKAQRVLVELLLTEQYRQRKEIIHQKVNESSAQIGDREIYNALATGFTWLEKDDDFVNAFLETDEIILKEGIQSGSTGTLCVVIPDQEHRKEAVKSGKMGVFDKSGMRKYEVITANIGDSSALLYHNGAVKRLTTNHEPNDKEELDRINKAGGFVDRNRVDGLLAVSRSFGDPWAKKNKSLSVRDQKCIAVPNVTRFNFEVSEHMRKEDEPSFLLIGCDGLWSGVGEEEAVKIIRQQLREQWEKEGKKSNMLFRFNLGRICENLADLSVQSKDNVSVIVVLLNQEMY